MSSSSAPTSCAICCEVVDPDNMRKLSSCSHQSCNKCILKWIQREENSGQSVTTCPFCRLELSSDETSAILGRPYQPNLGRRNIDGTDDEIDELTSQWLDQYTKSCPSCQARIQKSSNNDCDLMECLCGYRFCFNCGAQGGSCGCTPATHGFWDNVLNRHSCRSQPPLLAEKVEGQVDLKNYRENRIRQAKKRAQDQQKARRIRFSENRVFVALLNHLKENDPPLYTLVKSEIDRFVREGTGVVHLPSRLRSMVGERHWHNALSNKEMMMHTRTKAARNLRERFLRSKETSNVDKEAKTTVYSFSFENSVIPADRGFPARISNKPCASVERFLRPKQSYPSWGPLEAWPLSANPVLSTEPQHALHTFGNANQPVRFRQHNTPSDNEIPLSPPSQQTIPFWEIPTTPLAPKPYSNFSSDLSPPFASQFLGGNSMSSNQHCKIRSPPKDQPPLVQTGAQQSEMLPRPDTPTLEVGVLRDDNLTSPAKETSF